MNQGSIQILEALIQYQKERSFQGLSDFAYWILDSSKKTDTAINLLDSSQLENEIEEEISRLLILMYRYAKSHLKVYLSDYHEINQEDFTYLYALKRSGSVTKTELVEMNVHDKTTGLEIVRRLVKNNLIEEVVNQNDKRSKKLIITQKGEELIPIIKETTRKIAKLIAGELSEEEKINFYQILKKLDNFHYPIYSDKHRPQLDIVLDKFSLN